MRESTKNDGPGSPLVNGGLDPSSLSHLPSPFSGPQGRILLSTTVPAGHNSHQAEVCRICPANDPVEDGRSTRFNLMAT